MSLKKNIVANYLGQGWAAVMGIVFIPLYVKYLGMEAYGLIGVFAILQACLTLLDLGMTPTLNREMARYTAGAHTVQTISNLLRSLEVICFSVALTIGVLICLSANWLARHWLRAENLPIDKVTYAICIMGVVVALRFIESLYRGAILGLQRQVLFNVVNSFMATIRSLGILGILAWVSPTIEAFFIWQGIVSIVVLGMVVYMLIPTPQIKPIFSIKALSGVWRFAGSMMTTTFLSLMLLQTDKVLLSRLLSLQSFGYYTFAASVSGALYLFAVPIAQSFSPRFTELATLGDIKSLTTSYHQAAQLVTVMVMPFALVLIFFAEPLVLLWTSNLMLANKVAPIISLLTFGSALNALMYTPYMIQLGYGWASFSVRVNFIAVVLLVPSLIWITPHYGAIGAAWAWAVVNILYVAVATHFMHRRLLKQEKWTWYIYDVLLPLSSAALIVVVSWIMHPSNISRVTDFFWILITGISAFFASLYASNTLRNHISNWILVVRI